MQKSTKKCQKKNAKKCKKKLGGLHQTPPEQIPLGADPRPPGADTPLGSRHPTVNRITHACKNITFPQLR